MLNYKHFFEYLGAQNDHAEATQNGRASAATGTYYSEAIGIAPDEAQTAVSILLKTYHRRVDLDRQRERAINEAATARARGDRQGLDAALSENAAALAGRKYILTDLWAELQQNLGEML